ncbi:MAG: hypothetical protein U0U09_12695 [Cyclobacteriaceae bacterium]
MKQGLLILGAIAILSVLLIARIVVVHQKRLGDEEKWFAQSLGYEFSAEIDSVKMYNSNGGRVWARITAGSPKVYREDSLKNYFKQHGMMYFIFDQSGDSICFILQYANRLTLGDSVRISSSQDKVTIFHEGKSVAQEPLSKSVVGYGDSPFKRD